MTREQAINYLISVGLTQDQVGDVVRALTYKPRDCANCKHYVVTDTRTNWGSQETTKIYGCECWECEYEPTTKNDCEHCSKTYGTLGCCDFVSNEPVYSCKEGHEEYARGIRKLGSTTKNNLGVDCISRADAIKAMQNKAKKLKNEDTINGLCGAVAILYEMPSVTPQLSVPEVTALAEWTEKLTKASEDAYNKGYEAGRKELEPITSKDKFIYALTACGCLLKDGKTWYEHNELIKCFEDLGLFEQEPILDKIRKQIKSNLRGVEIALEVLAENHPLRQKMEGAKDTLEDCLEIIDKAESEANNGKDD